MSRAEELLDSLTEDQIMMYGVNPSEEPHIVIESDKTVTVPDDLRHIAVQGEHNIETVTFDCPRYWDGHDLSHMGMRIVYQRPDGHREPHPVENLRVDDVDENTIHFDWTVSGNVTAVKGNISFMVCAKLSDSEGNIEREWHTRLNQDLIVDEGMDCSGDEIVEQNPDIIEAILAQLDDLKNAGGISDEQVANAVAAYLTENPIESGVDEQEVQNIIADYLEENPVEITDVVKTVNGVSPDENGNVEIAIPDSGQNVALTAAQINLLEDAFEHIQWVDETGPQYAAQLIASLRGGESGGTEPEPEQPTKTLERISAEYTGGNVPVGTAVSGLSGVTVTAHYSDGSTANVTGYTLSGSIVEGENTVTVTYMGKTATITVTGEAQAAEGRKLLHNWVANSENNTVDSVGGASMTGHNAPSITKDGYTLVNSDDSLYFSVALVVPNRSIEIDFGTVQNVPNSSGNCSVLFVWGTASHPRGGKYWCGWYKPSSKWFWMDTSDGYTPDAYIDQFTDPNIVSGKTVKFVVNAAGNISLYIDDAFISTAPFTVVDTPYFQLGKPNEAYNNTTITAIRVYEEVA